MPVFALEVLWPGVMAFAASYAALPWLDLRAPLSRALVVGTTLALLWRYLLWRLLATLPAPALSADWALSVAFAAAEATTLLGTSITLLCLTRTRDRSAEVEAAMPLFLAAPAPLVDVFICTYNEGADILESTIVGALALSHRRLRVWVLDDGRRGWLEALCARKGVGYLTRRDNAHAKAGNINNGLAHVCALADAPDYIAILDADFVPKSNFLSRTLPLFHDPAVGVVQTPQHFINPDPIQSNLGISDAWPDEQRYFFDVLMPSKDAWGVTFSCGTSSVIRRSALQAIGGVPTGSVTEDYLLTLALRNAGLQTVYLNEKLSLGLAPEGLKEYITQRSRWCLGLVQICRGPLGPFARNALSWRDRLGLVEALLYWAGSYSFRLMCLLVPVLYWFFGVRALQADVGTALSYFLPYYVTQIAAQVWLSERRMLPVMADVGQLLVATDILRSVAGGVARRDHRFVVTAKGGDRSRLVVQWRLLARFAGMLALTVAGMALAYLPGDGHAADQAGALCLFWSWYNVVVLLLTCLVCFERPRLRGHERVAAREPVMLGIAGVAVPGDLRDISVGGMLVACRAVVAVGEAVRVRFDQVEVDATVARCGAGQVALCFDHDEATRDAVIRKIYSGRYLNDSLTVRSTRLAQALTMRVLG